MIKKIAYGFALVCLWLLLAQPAYFAHAQDAVQTDLPAEWAPPEGFQQALSDQGVILFRKTYPNGTPDYVQMVFLNQGAGIELLHAGVAQDRPGRGVFGGSDARFNLNNLPNYWYLVHKANDSAFCVSNGSFFYMPETPTRLPFPLKKDGVILTDGFGQDQYTGQKLMLELWLDHADIRPLTGEDLYQSSAPNILGGLAEDANKRAKFSVGRTFAGVQDQDGDGKMETLYLLNSQTHTQSSAAQVLRDFGAQKVMMLDGGGSTQLLCQGKEIIPSERLIPQAIAVFAASPESIALSASAASAEQSGSLDQQDSQTATEQSAQETLEAANPQINETATAPADDALLQQTAC